MLRLELALYRPKNKFSFSRLPRVSKLYVFNSPYTIHPPFVDACAFYLVRSIQLRILFLIQYMLETLESQFLLGLPLKPTVLACIESIEIMWNF